jgi:hypothetical protein
MPSRLRRIGLVLCGLPLLSFAGSSPALPIFPLKDIRPGLKGVGYTIFAGDRREKFDVEVLGVLPNLMGPRQDVVLVRLSSPWIARSGVVAGMSGSPVYIQGRLAGAISLKFGMFTTEALAGMTPIEQILAVGNQSTGTSGPPGPGLPEPASTAGTLPQPIETPLVLSGFYPQTLAAFATKLAQFGLVAVAGGTAPPAPGDTELQPGDMASLVLVRGDLSVAASCTVTARLGKEIFLCGHPLLGFGRVRLPLARAHVVTTLSSTMASTKIINTGGLIGSVIEDRATGVLARLGPPPPMIPVTLRIEASGHVRQYRFEVMENPKLTPLLVAAAAFNGLHSYVHYDEGVTYRLRGHLELVGHPAVQIEELFPPSSQPVADALPLSTTVQSIFSDIFNNPYEQARIRQVTLEVTATPGVRWATIEGAWADRREVRRGQTLLVSVALRPYRGQLTVLEVPVRIPEQAASGPLRVLVSDGPTLNNLERQSLLGSRDHLTGLDELIGILNRQRRNDSLYVTLLQNGPTLMVEDKRLPNVPLSEINVLGQRSAARAVLLWESELSSRAVPVHEVVTGQQSLTVTVK